MPSWWPFIRKSKAAALCAQVRDVQEDAWDSTWENGWWTGADLCYLAIQQGSIEGLWDDDDETEGWRRG